MWCPRGSPNDRKIKKPWVEKAGWRSQVPDGGNPADGKASLVADKRCIGFAKRFACHLACLLRVNTVAASSQEQQDLPTVFAPKDDRLGDLVQLTADRFGRLCRGAGRVWHGADVWKDTRFDQCGLNPSFAFAHAFNPLVRCGLFLQMGHYDQLTVPPRRRSVYP